MGRTWQRRTVPRETRAIVINTHGRVCHLCRGSILPAELSIDHVVPRSRGGSDAVENLRPAHIRCNRIKDNLMPETKGAMKNRVNALRRWKERRR
jgi:5-methylcytosine-specific restriction endonuclease McrA